MNQHTQKKKKHFMSLLIFPVRGDGADYLQPQALRQTLSVWMTTDLGEQIQTYLNSLLCVSQPVLKER